MFLLDEKVVYPGHGVAKINRIIEKEFGGQKTSFYELVFINKGGTILVPIQSVESVGLRRLSSVDKIEKAFDLLSTPAQKISNSIYKASNWNKRNKEYQLKLRTGSLEGISEIYRDLKHASSYKELSFGEKNLLNQAETLLVEEISFAKQTDIPKTVESIRSLIILGQQKSKNQKSL